MEYTGSGVDRKIHRRGEKFRFSDINFIRAVIFFRNLDITSRKSRVINHTIRRFVLPFPLKKAFQVLYLIERDLIHNSRRNHHIQL